MKRWAILYAAMIILLIVLADTGRLGFLHRVYDFPYGDKVGHFVLFGFLGFLVNLAVYQVWPRVSIRSLAVRTSGTLAVLIGLEEFSQRWFSTRTSSVIDLAASYAGLALFTWLAVRIGTRKRDPLEDQPHPAPGDSS